uniref:Uncharacterized protein n=1 Tax=Lepeophtheirus salmonis TaxID=72036 RepID=A0A0K2UWB9_LEPSM
MISTVLRKSRLEDTRSNTIMYWCTETFFFAREDVHP